MTLPHRPRKLGIEPNPCDERAEMRNWDAVRRVLGDILNVISDDGDIINIINGILVKFRLNATLAPGGSASATKLNWDTATSTWVDAETITVYDDQPSDPWRGLVNYEGWARRKHEDDAVNHSIVWMERVAYFITGTLAEDLVSPGPANATVLSFSDGVDPGANVSVWDVNSRFPEAKQGAAFTAYYDFTAQRYELAVCQQRDWVATAFATQDFDGSDVTVNVNAVTMKSYSEYDQGGEVVTQVRNTFKQIGDSGDPLHIQKSAASGLWEIVTAPEQTGGGDGDQIIQFRLTEELWTGSSALAVIITWNGAAYVEGAQVRVYDWYSLTPQEPGINRGMWQGDVGMEGFARKRDTQSSTPNEYDIIWMEQYARYIMVTLNEDMGETNDNEASAILDFSWGQGCAPDNNNGLVIVHDDMQAFPKALVGAKAFAIRDEYAVQAPSDPYYSLIISQQMVLFAGADAAETVCEQQFRVTISGFTGWSFSIFNQEPDPLPEQALNPFNHVFSNGTSLALLWGRAADPAGGDPEDGWIIIDAEKTATDIVFDFRIKDDKTCIEAQVATCAVEMCEEPAWECKVPLTECP